LEDKGEFRIALLKNVSVTHGSQNQAVGDITFLEGEDEQNLLEYLSLARMTDLIDKFHMQIAY